jgi:esterase/lipase superfamily enzyme
MSKTDVEKLLTDLNEGRILTQQTFEGLDVEVYLDERDASAFADEWMQAFERWVQASAVAEEEVLRGCREQAFKQTLALTSKPELAGYVSDDMGLIGAALLQGAMNDSFVDQLLESYHQGRLPLR